jgi:hypothetical protein
MIKIIIKNNYNADYELLITYEQRKAGKQISCLS